MTAPLAEPVQVLVVEDEAPIAQLLQLALQHEGWQVTVVSDGLAALSAVAKLRPQLLILDIMLPGMHGVQVLRSLRQQGDTTPVLLLSALAAVDDKVRALLAGGDDYVTKPFSVAEVVARVHNLLRRGRCADAAPQAPARSLQCGDLVLDESASTVRRGEQTIELTLTEYELLRFLLQNPAAVLSKQQILEHVWGADYSGKITVVELYISYLRKKIDEPWQTKLLHTVRGRGYMLREP